MERRVRGDPEKIKLRKRPAERHFGPINRHWHRGYFLARTLPSLSAEMALTILTLGIMRALKILGGKR